MARNKETSRNLQLAGVFVLFVFGLILLSVIVKIGLIVKDSAFDGSHLFTIALESKNQTKVVSFFPQNKSIAVLDIEGDMRSQDLISFLQAPVDSAAILENVESSSVTSALLSAAFKFDRYSKLTILDVLRLFLFAKTTSGSSVSEKTISSFASEQDRQKIASIFFHNPVVNQENVTIEIINAADTIGLGTKLANMIGNMGGNVILVLTADNPVNNSKIVYSGKETYTVRKLSNFLHFPKQKSDRQEVANIVIIIGKDGLDKLKF
jgi:hypothetical protein